LESCYLKEGKNSKDALLMSALGRAYKELKLYDSAAQIYETALDAHPNSLEFINELINILIDRKDYDKAIERALKFKDENPMSADVYNSLARIYYRQKKLEMALANLQKLMKLDLNNAEAMYFAGLVLNDMGRGEEACEVLLGALGLNPKQSKYYAQTARAYLLAGNFESAALFIKEAIGMAPQEPGYFKLALEIAKNANDKAAVKSYTSQISRLEKVLKER
jgi:tetratricopeptide (TPR) repeat protein